MNKLGTIGELFKAARRVRETTVQFSPPYQHDETHMVLVPKVIWDRLVEAIEEYERQWFGNK